MQGRHLEIQQDEGDAGQAGQEGEIEDDHGRTLAFIGDQAQEGVGHAGGKSAEEADQGRNRRHSSGGLDDKNRPGKGKSDQRVVQLCRLFLQEKYRCDDRKERRHLIQDIGIRQAQAVNCPEVCDHAQRSKQGAEKKSQAGFLLSLEPSRPRHPHNGDGRDDGRDGISEKGLLHGRKIACSFYAEGHQREPER